MSAKKFFTIFMIIFMLFSVSGCGGSGGHTQNLTNTPVSPDKPVPIPEPQSDDITTIPEPSPLSQDKPVSQEPISTPIISHDPMPPILYTVTFNSNGGSAVSNITVSSGNTVTKPNDPSKYGYTFGGWYKDSALTQTFKFGSNGDKVISNITLYAKWIETDILRTEAAIDKVSIGYQSGDSMSNVTKNLTLPTSVNASGDVSISWSSNNPSVISNSGAVTRPSGRDTVVVLTATATAGSVSRTKTFTVTVIHKATPAHSGYTVTFNSNGGSTVDNINISFGGTVNMPENPTKVGYVFAGWFKDEAFTEIFMFGTDGDKITKDTTLYAQWINADTLRAEYALAEIIIGYANGDNPKYVTQNLSLPQKAGDANITWASSNASVISSNGTVTRPNGSDAEVTLTATARSRAEAETKEFNVKVIRARSRVSSDVEVTDVQNAGNGDLSITYKNSGDQIVDIEGNYSKLTINNADDALDAIQSIHEALGINNPYEELQTYLVTSDCYGSEYSFQQVYKGVKVFGRSIMASTNALGKGNFLHSSFLTSSILDSADMQINLTASQAEEYAKNAYSGNIAVDIARTERIVYSLENYEKAPEYAYIVRIYGTSGDEYIDKDVFINAKTSKIINSFTNIYHSSSLRQERIEGKNELGEDVTFPVTILDISMLPTLPETENNVTYLFMFDATETPYIQAYIENLHTPAKYIMGEVLNDGPSISAYTNMREVMQWWQGSFKRNSLDNRGMAVKVVTHVWPTELNAAWKPSEKAIFINERATYSSGLIRYSSAVADVLAHETTHAVMYYDLTIPYKNITGAIHEGYADILGCTKEQSWLFGEKQFTLKDNLRCVRNIGNPHDVQAMNTCNIAINPTTRPGPLNVSEHLPYTTDSNYDSENGDEGGVHKNSFIISRTAYLMHQDNIPQNGLTWDEIGQVWYKSLHMGLSATSNFEDVRRCVLWAAQEINLPENKIAAIKSAFDEVGITATSSINTKLSGTVTDYDTDSNIPGVSVFLFDGRISADTVIGNLRESRHTNSAGEYSFECEAGTYPIVMVDEDYVTFMGIVTIMKSEDIKLDTKLVRVGNGSLNGTISRNLGNLPLEDVTVNIRHGFYVQTTSVLQSTTTDTNGQYSFTSLNNGYYTVELIKKGYETATFNVIISGNTTGQDWYMSRGDIPIDEEHFPDDIFRAYIKSNFDTDSNDILSPREIGQVTQIDVSFATLPAPSKISSLEGIKYFSALQYLYCNDNQLTALDVSNCTNLQTLRCDNNQLTTLKISGCVSLQELSCENNYLTVLDISSNTNLRWLYCYNNQLTALDLNKNTTMQDLLCYNNQLTTLDVSGCTVLERLQCDNNQLTAFDVSGCTALQGLSCSFNQLTVLDVSSCTALQTLHCNNNQLTALYVSDCTTLFWLDCRNNQLTTLDLSTCPKFINGDIRYISGYLGYDSNVTIIWPTSTASSASVFTHSDSDHTILAVLPPFTPAESGTYTFIVSLDRTPPEDSSLLLLSDSEDLNASFAMINEADTVRLSVDFIAGRLYAPVIVAETEQQEQSGGCNSGVLGMVLLITVLLRKRRC